MKFLIRANQELDCWEVYENNAIDTDEGSEKTLLDTFCDFDRAFQYVTLINETKKVRE